jgi:hypothetical protein
MTTNDTVSDGGKLDTPNWASPTPPTVAAMRLWSTEEERAEERRQLVEANLADFKRREELRKKDLEDTLAKIRNGHQKTPERTAEK